MFGVLLAAQPSLEPDHPLYSAPGRVTHSASIQKVLWFVYAGEARVLMLGDQPSANHQEKEVRWTFSAPGPVCLLSMPRPAKVSQVPDGDGSAPAHTRYAPACRSSTWSVTAWVSCHCAPDQPPAACPGSVRSGRSASGSKAQRQRSGVGLDGTTRNQLAVRRAPAVSPAHCLLFGWLMLAFRRARRCSSVKDAVVLIVCLDIHHQPSQD